MSAERDTTRIVRSWLRADEHESADRVLQIVLAGLDATPQRRSWWPARRFSPMSNPIRFAPAVAAVLALAFVLTRFAPAAPSAGSPGSPPARASAVPSPSAAAPIADLPVDGDIAPGRYRLAVPASDVHAVLSLGAGWTAGGGGVSTPSWYVASPIGSISFWIVGNVGTDACKAYVTAPDPPVGPGVDDLVSALVAQRHSDTTAPTAVTIRGHPGMRLSIERTKTLPAGCDQLYWFLDSSGQGGRGAVAGETVPDQLYVLDVDGQRVVVVAYVSGADQVFNDVLTSMQLSRG